MLQSIAGTSTAQLPENWLTDPCDSSNWRHAREITAHFIASRAIESDSCPAATGRNRRSGLIVCLPCSHAHPPSPFPSCWCAGTHTHTASHSDAHVRNGGCSGCARSALLGLLERRCLRAQPQILGDQFISAAHTALQPEIHATTCNCQVLLLRLCSWLSPKLDGLAAEGGTLHTQRLCRAAFARGW